MAGFRQELVENIASAVCPHDSPEERAIQGALSRRAESILMTTRIPTDDPRPVRTELVASFVGFWRDWPRTPRTRPILVLPTVKYRSHATGVLQRIRTARRNQRLRRMVDDIQSSLAGEHVTVLPELESVPHDDADDWAVSDPVRAFCAERDVVEEVRTIYRGVDRVPMDPLAGHLRKILMTRATEG